jgi:hypothetical protein
MKEQNNIFNDKTKNEFSINNDRFSFINSQNDLIEDPVINSSSQDAQYIDFNNKNITN